MEGASLLKVINAHNSSVKCLFFDEWQLLPGDSEGKVMAWSIICAAAGCLMTFNHPKGLKSLTLTYLRVINGCSDGKICIFNFVTGDCLRDITLWSDSGPLLSLHFQDHRVGSVEDKEHYKGYNFQPSMHFCYLKSNTKRNAKDPLTIQILDVL